MWFRCDVVAVCDGAAAYNSSRRSSLPSTTQLWLNFQAVWAPTLMPEPGDADPVWSTPALPQLESRVAASPPGTWPGCHFSVRHCHCRPMLVAASPPSTVCAKSSPLPARPMCQGASPVLAPSQPVFFLLGTGEDRLTYGLLKFQQCPGIHLLVVPSFSGPLPAC